MSDRSDQFPGIETVRLFPLPNVVLLPNGLLPLQIFEPRYKQMMEDVLADDRRMAIVLIKEPGPPEPTPIHPVACVGEVFNERRLPDGRFLFVLRGQARVRIDHEIETERLYRTAKVDVLEDELLPQGDMGRKLFQAEILRCLRILLANDDDADAFMGFLSQECRPGPFSDIVAYTARLSPATKQRLLETTSVDDRLQQLQEHLQEVTQGADDADPNDPRHFSKN
ncbi:Lon protease [Planctomycetes bacterium Pan216]|uniref:Lon protease n=1 Tax=Kolteria novifilia TaxID=2527975 RepID=A0A518B0N3_9BACT|nr:Lon protease [Planctomycetes bacterium Pan216]